VKKLLLAIPIAFLLTLLFTVPVFASIAAPDTIAIYNVWVYRNCIETGDQLYLIDFIIDYTSNPTTDAGSAFIIRLMNGATELGSTSPYAYYDEGYDRGVASIYLDASEAPTWEGSYEVEIIGNPTLDWTPSQPSTDESSFNWMGYSSVNETQDYIAGRILSLAQTLDNTWDASYTLLESTTEGQYLSENGVEYFAAVVDNLQVIAPKSLSYRNVDLDYDRTDPMYDYDNDYSDSLEDNIEGTPLDVTDGATLLGVSRGALTAFLYYGVIFLGLLKFYPRLQSTKSLVAVMIPLVIAGAFIGVPLQVTIVVAFIAFLMIGYALFYKNTAT